MDPDLQQKRVGARNTAAIFNSSSLLDTYPVLKITRASGLFELQ
jgi:hypothetical protein